MKERACLVVLLIVLSASFLSSCDSGQIDTSSSSASCTNAQITVSASWTEGIRFTLNHCMVVDVLVGSALASAVAGDILADCPNVICKGVAGAIAAFIISQATLLQDADSVCQNRGAI